MEISVITANISAEFLTPAGPASGTAGVDRFARGHGRQLAYLQGELPEFTPLDRDPAMTAVWLAKYGRYGLPELSSSYEITAALLDALVGW